jgi:hypothetical protein
MKVIEFEGIKDVKEGKFDATDIITHKLSLKKGEHAC